jgi:hypothetical protein
VKDPRTIGPTGDDLVSAGHELKRLLQAGNVYVNVVHLVQIGDHVLAPEQAARLAPVIEDMLLRSAVKPDPFAAGVSGGSNLSPARKAMFRYGGHGTWEIGFSGQVCFYRDAIGLHQAHYLLLRPGQRVPVLELAEVRHQHVVVNRLCFEDVADPKALAQYSKQLDSLKDELAIAQDTGNAERIAALEGEFEALKRHCSSARSCSGATRRLRDQGDRLRKRVSFTLRSSIRNISGRNPDTGEHLRASIKLGFECGYFPTIPVRWAL